MKKMILIWSFSLLAVGNASALSYSECENNEFLCYKCGDECSARMVIYDEDDKKAEPPFLRGISKDGTPVINVKGKDYTYEEFQKKWIRADFIVSGKGKMYDYRSPYNNFERDNLPPWGNLDDALLITDVTASKGVRSWYRPDITKVVVEKEIEHIGEYAFYLQNTIREVELPYTLTSIGTFAFFGNPMLGSVKIPDSVKRIGLHAFQNSVY